MVRRLRQLQRQQPQLQPQQLQPQQLRPHPPGSVPIAQADATPQHPQMVRRDGIAVRGVRHHGHVDDVSGEAGGRRRPGPAGHHEGR